jgi:O-antigen/teichoic acid export membrane protein
LSTAEPTGARDDIAGLAKGSGFGVIGTVLSQSSLFVIVALLAAARGTNGVGLYSESFAVFTLLSLLSLLGFQTTLTRYVAMHLVAHEDGDIRRVVRFGLILTTAAAVVTSAILLVGAPWLARALHQPELATPLRLVAIALIPATYTKAAAAVIQGYNELRDFAIASLMVEPVIRVILTVVAIVATNRPLVGAMVALVISNLLSAIWAGRIMRRLLPQDTRPSLNYRLRPVLSFTTLTWSAAITTNGLIWADTLLLGWLRSSSEVGIYQVATRIVTLATSAAVPIASAFAPRITELIRRKQWDRLGAAYKLSTTWSVRICLPFLALCLLVPHQVLRLFGNSFAAGATVTIILVIGKAVDTATGPCGMVLNMSSRVGTNAALNITTLIANILLNLWLIPDHGIIGAALAWTICLVMLNVGRVISVQRLIGISPWSRSLGASVFACVPGVVAALLLSTQLSGRPLLLADVVAVLALYAIASRLLGWSADDSLVVRSVTPRVPVRSRERVPSWAPASTAPWPIRQVSMDRPVTNGDAPTLRLDELISPLRYDIVLRSSFMALIATHRDMADRDLKSFLRLALTHPYYRWYREIAWSFNPRAARAIPVDVHFRWRVARSIELFDSFQRNGFDSRCPVTVRRVTKPALTVDGKCIGNRFVPLDGCHRLALLANAGFRELTPDMYVIDTSGVGPPRDNTVRVLPFSSLNEREYFSFIGRGYGVTADSEVTLLLAVAAKGAQQVDEVRSILKVDLPVIRQTPHPLLRGAVPEPARRPPAGVRT